MTRVARFTRSLINAGLSRSKGGRFYAFCQQIELDTEPRRFNG